MRGFKVSQLIFIGKNSGFGAMFSLFKDLHKANNNRRQMPRAVMFSSTSKTMPKITKQPTTNLRHDVDERKSSFIVGGMAS